MQGILVERCSNSHGHKILMTSDISVREKMI